MRRIWLLLGLLAGILGLAANPAPAVEGVSAATPLGTLTTVQVTLSNTGQPAATAQLFEAFDPAGQAPATPPTGPLRVPLPAAPGPITPELLAAFSKSPAVLQEMLIYLADQADLSAAAANPDWNARGAAVVAALQQQAAQSQAPLLAQLRGQGYAPRSFWIVNAIEVSGTQALAQQMAGQPAVAVVAANTRHVLDNAPPQAVTATGDPPAWGLDRIRAPSVWADWGVRGTGITVANLDTGVAYTHTALAQQYRGWSPAGYSHDYNWYDAAGDKPSPVPIDLVGHGTHTMGTMVGGPAGGFSALGVAPDARWIAARACEGIFCDDAALIAGAQWLLAPTNLAGKNPRPDLRPQVINNSWGQPGDSAWYSGYVTAWNAAGIFSAFAGGNSGQFSSCQNTITPGSYAQSFSVGATDNTDNIAGFSSRGPTSDGRIKPDISAPGVNIPSTWPGGGVALLSGTSMATPHAAGVVALLWSANPTLMGDLSATEYALTSTARPRPTAECSPLGATPNNVYGWGRLDARAAVQQARVDIPWLSLPATVALPANGSAQFSVTLDGRQVSVPGTYTARILALRGASLSAIPVTFTVLPAANTASVRGHLTDLWQGGDVYGMVRVGAGPAVQTDASGQYTVTLPYAAYPLTATASGYFSATLQLAVSGPAAADFVLQPDRPHLEVSAGPLSATLAFGQQAQVPITITNAGSRPLTVAPSVPAADWVVEAAGAPAGPLYDLSSAAPISLTDDSIYSLPVQLGFPIPIYGQLVSQLYLSSNGWVSAVQPQSAAPLANCLPSTSLPGAALAPFWADLDPGAGGVVRFGHVDANTFVFSFEQVPPWRETPDPAGPTDTFQLALHADGQVEFLYGDMGALPDRWSVGASQDELRGQHLACYRDDTALAHTVWRLRNQPDSRLWLASSTSSLIVKPGQSAVFMAVLSGFGFVPWHLDPFMASLWLESNDTGQPSFDLAAQASVGPPAYQIKLPVVAR